jgi:hypothetical protein
LVFGDFHKGLQLLGREVRIVREEGLAGVEEYVQGGFVVGCKGAGPRIEGFGEGFVEGFAFEYARGKLDGALGVPREAALGG